MVNAPVDGWPPDGTPTPKVGVSDTQLAKWYEQHFAFVWRTLRRFGVGPGELEDAVQDVFLVAHRRREDFEHRAAPRTWLYAIARRVASDRRRTRDRRVRREQAYATSRGSSRDAERKAAREHPDAWIFVEQFLEGLDEDLREAFVLFELEGLRASEAADLTGVNANTLYARRRRARQQFGAAIEASRIEADRVSGAMDRGARDVAPPAGSQRRVAALLPFFMLDVLDAAELAGAAGSTGGAGTTWLAIKTALASAAATAAVVTVAAVGVRSSRGAPAQDRIEVPAATTAAMAPGTGATSSAPTAAPEAKATPAVPADTADSADPADSAGQTATPAPALSPAVRAPHPAATQAPPDTDTLSAQVTAHRAARQALTRGDTAAALLAADAYLVTYPKGDFVLPTRVLRIEALCAAGQAAKARGERTLLLQAHPNLPGRAKIEALCAATP